MNRYVTLSANQTGDYSFLLPLSAMVWRKVAKYTPVAILTETREHWDNPKGRVVNDMIERLGVRRHYVGTIKEPYRTSVQAQASRQHLALLSSFQPDEYVLTSDVDMAPLVEWWWNKQDWTKDVHIWYANAWDWHWYTTGYIGMKVATWREVMCYEAGPSIAPVLEAALERHLTPERDTWQEWWFDEHYFSARLRAWKGFPDRVQFMEREGKPPRDRIDRSNWALDFDGKVDAHVLRPATSAENWPHLFAFFLRLLSANECEEVAKYHDRYMEAAR